MSDDLDLLLRQPIQLVHQPVYLPLQRRLLVLRAGSGGRVNAKHYIGGCWQQLLSYYPFLRLLGGGGGGGSPGRFGPSLLSGIGGGFGLGGGEGIGDFLLLLIAHLMLIITKIIIKITPKLNKIPSIAFKRLIMNV